MADIQWSVSTVENLDDSLVSAYPTNFTFTLGTAWPVEFSLEGTLAGTSTATADAELLIVVQGAGSVIAEGRLEGQGASSRTGSGTTAAEARLEGTGLATHTAAGEVRAVGQLTGTGLAPDNVAQGSGEVVSQGRLDGDGRSQRKSEGEVAATGSLQGSGLLLDPPNLQALVTGDDVSLTWDASVLV